MEFELQGEFQLYIVHINSILAAKVDMYTFIVSQDTAALATMHETPASVLGHRYLPRIPFISVWLPPEPSRHRDCRPWPDPWSPVSMDESMSLEASSELQVSIHVQ
jgi:hypothetical protein